MQQTNSQSVIAKKILSLQNKHYPPKDL